MTRRAGRLAQGQEISDGLVQTLVLLVCFLGAGVAGCLTVAVAGEDGVSSLSAYLNGYMEMLGEGAAEAASLWSVIWELCRWPLLVFLLGWTALGAIAIPAVFCVRGFLLGYSIASFVRVFGTAGVLCALAVFGMTALASVPVLFCVGALAFPSSLRLAVGVFESRPAAVLPKERLWSLIPCGGLLALAVALEWSVMPQLLAVVADMLPKV